MATYEVSWEETSKHTVQLTTEELAKLLDVTPEQFDQDPGGFASGLSDALADLDYGFEFLTRDGIEVTALNDAAEPGARGGQDGDRR